MKTSCTQKCGQSRQCTCREPSRRETIGAAIVIVVVTALFVVAIISGGVVYNQYYLGGV